MQKAATLPSSSWEWRTHATDASDVVAMRGNHSVQRSCSFTCVSDAGTHRGGSLSTSRDEQEQQQWRRQHSVFENDKVFFGWLFVESSVRKRKFKWRFCILDGAHFSYFRDNARDAKCLGHHVLAWVERLHCINRGLLLIDDEQRRIWAHAGHETSSFEEWFGVFRSGIDYARRRRDGSIFERPSRDLVGSYGSTASESRSYKQSQSAATRTWGREEDLDVSYTGWLVVRKRWLRLNWLYSSASRLYFVLSDRHLSAFTVNVEGQWVDLYGKIARVRPYKSGFWLEVVMEDGRRIRVAGKTPEVTVQWLKRMQRALQRDNNTRRTV